jgi:hypothetical protein
MIERSRLRRSALLALTIGLLPWSTGLLVTVTRNILCLAVAGVLVSSSCSVGMYWLRKSYGRADAKQWLIIEPLLFGCYFVVSAVLINYVFLRR